MSEKERMRNMSITLKPIGNYIYDPDSCSFDEAWKQLEEAYRTKSFVICQAVRFSETDGSLDIDYHHIRGKIKRGYITQDRYLPSEFFDKKTFCIQITSLCRKRRSFTASRLPVEIEARAILQKLILGTPLTGNLIKIGTDDNYGFIDVMEGITFYLSENNITWKPRECQKISDHFSVGDQVTGYVVFLEGANPEHSSAGRISCINLREDWLPATVQFTVGTIVNGIAQQVSNFPGKYYITLSPLVYIEFYSSLPIPSGTRVQVRVANRDDAKYRIWGELEKILTYSNPISVEDFESDPEPISIEDSESSLDSNIDETIELQEKSAFYSHQFTAPVKATVSPFALRKGEEKEFECVPNHTPSYRQVQNSVRAGHINEFHFQVLEVVDALVFCTSKMIAGYMSVSQMWPKGLSRDKLNHRLESMVKLGLLDRLRFSSEESASIYRVYFLGKNGELLLRAYRNTRRTSYDPLMLATPVEEVKRYLATNQIILAYMQTFQFFEHFLIRKVYNADNDTPIRIPGSLMFENSHLLLETQRRYTGWQENLLEKANRYYRLVKKHQSGTLPDKSQILQHKKIYLLLVCEDIAHAMEIRDLLYGHALYPYLFFTYDLLVFQRDINQSIFSFGVDNSIIYYDITELLHYNIKKDVSDSSSQTENDGAIDEFLKCLSESYSVALAYLQNHDCLKLQRYVQTELTALYQIDNEQKYIPVYPNEEQYYVWLLYVISHNLLKAPTATFFEECIQLSCEEHTPPPKPIQAIRIEPNVLEEAVQLVVSQLEKYITKKHNSTIIKHSTIQTSGTQFGYDIGMDFHAVGNNYRLGFECKSYQTLREKNEAGGDVRLRVGEYGKNLLQYYMYCNKGSNERNFWILVSPYADLQNDFQKNLVDRWNNDIPFMKIKAITRHQSEVDCETFFSLVPEAFRMVYQRTGPLLIDEEKELLLEKIYKYIVGERTIDNDIAVALEDYNFSTNTNIPKDQRLTLRTADGDDILFTILQALANNRNIFLIGEYGSGKTYMTFHLIETILANPDEYAYCPFWFRLVEQEMGSVSEYPQKAKTFIEEGFRSHSEKIRKQLHSSTKRPLVILDGLDELSSGLGCSSEKRNLLMEILKAATRFFGRTVLFLVSSREIDFNSCFNSKEIIPELRSFKNILIGDCQLEDAVKKLQTVEQDHSNSTEKSDKSLTSKRRLMEISRKPLYYGFLRDMILERDIIDIPENEIDLLKEIIKRSIEHYLNEEDNQHLEIEYNDVFEWLCDAAIHISVLRTRGAARDNVYIANKRLVQKCYLKNVVRIKAIQDNQYHVMFYHNAIREFLVAYKISEEVKNHLYDGFTLDDFLCTILQDVALTPEMIGFFCALIETEKDVATQQLKALLQKIQSPRYSLIGTNLISMLCRMDLTNPGLRDMDLHGIYADALHLYRCVLENLNLQKAHLNNLHLLDVRLKNVDFREANLSGLVLGHNGSVMDASHRKQGHKVSIYGLYENQQVVEYQFEDIQELKFKIITHPTLQEKYSHLCITGDNVALYTDRKVMFINCPNQIYLLPQDCRLLKMTPHAVVMAKQENYELVYHQQSLREAIPTRLSPNQIQMICCLDRHSYLYYSDHTLYLNQDGALINITNITSTFECFTAIRDPNDQSVCAFIKYNEGIQEIRYKPTTQVAEVRNRPLPQAVYKNMSMIDCRWMYAVSDNKIFLLDLEQEELQPISLQIQVNSQNLKLEDSDGTRRVYGAREYQLLKGVEEKNEDIYGK